MAKFRIGTRRMLEVLLTLVISLVPVVSGLAVMLYQQDKKLEDNARVSVQEAIFSIDLALDRLRAAAITAMPFAGSPCESAKEHLLKQVQDIHFLRALAVATDGQTYCDTLVPALDTGSLFAHSQSSVKLIFDSPATPNAVLVAYQLREGDVSVIATTYGFELRNELRGFQDGLTLLLEFDDLYIWADGDSRDLAPPSQAEFFKTGKSSKFGYTVKAGYAEGFTAQETQQALRQILPSLSLVGIITGSIVFWGAFRQRGKRGRTAVEG
ncbi:CSS-motif domain-containing protein [Pseudomonas ceruminis]|uniref:CSS-motif domain-containing protein n=1 Tax=Pseudomonas ceruminis TaxID=2740516 RepID=UPI001596D612|nr:CSS-motif domain-containing protein [Pseudomonas ceruminis]